jgi:hypothetical protein
MRVGLGPGLQRKAHAEQLMARWSVPAARDSLVSSVSPTGPVNRTMTWREVTRNIGSVHKCTISLSKEVVRRTRCEPHFAHTALFASV